LGGIHLLSTLPFEENRLDLGVKKLAGLWVPGIEAVVVDEKGLMLQPVTPARLTDFIVHSLPDGVSKGGLLELRCGLPTTTTANGILRKG
jgi:hypothetical protein